MPTAGEFCNRTTVIAKKGETLLDVAHRMREHHVGSVIVVEHSEQGAMPVGILTDRDIVVRVLAATDRHIHAYRVSDVMTEDVVKAREDEDLLDVLKRMRAYGVRRVPVVNSTGHLQGIIALDDVVDFLQEQITDVSTLFSREATLEAKTSP